MAQNLYANRPPTPGEAPGATRGAYARPSYAAPDNDIPGSEEGFSPALGDYSEGMSPDEIRIGKREPLFGGPRATDMETIARRDDLERRSDEYQVSTGWNVRQEKPVVGVIPAQVQDIGPSRPSASRGQNTYLFMRPWERPYSTGEHFSLADHRRKYEIYGMKPQGGVGVNTYRLDPKPWDQNLHYNPVPVQPENQTQYPSGSVAGNRSFRLG